MSLVGRSRVLKAMYSQSFPQSIRPSPAVYPREGASSDPYPNWKKEVPSSPYVRTSGIGCCSQKRPDSILILASLDTFQISLFIKFSCKYVLHVKHTSQAPLHSLSSARPDTLVLFVPQTVLH